MSTIRSNEISLSSAMLRVEHTCIKRGLPMVIIGAPGCGKSSVALSLARRLQATTANFGGCYINLANKEAVDISGMFKITDGPLTCNGLPTALQPVPAERLRGAYPILCPTDLAATEATATNAAVTYGRRLPVNLHHTNELTRDMLRPYDAGLFIGDEFTKVIHEAVMGTAAGVAHEAMFGEWSLPRGDWGRLFIGNDVGHQSLDVPPPAHFRNRCAVYYVYTDIGAVCMHWQDKGMDDMFIHFAKEHASDVFSQTVPVTQEQFSTARSLELAWEALSSECENIYDIPNIAPAGRPYQPRFWPVMTDSGDGSMQEISKEVRATMAAWCGEVVATNFMVYALEWRERPRFAEILANPTTAKLPNHPGIMDSVVTMCAMEAQKDNLSTVVRYISRIPLALAALFCSKVKDRLPIVAMQNADYLKLLNDSGAVARAVTFS